VGSRGDRSPGDRIRAIGPIPAAAIARSLPVPIQARGMAGLNPHGLTPGRNRRAPIRENREAVRRRVRIRAIVHPVRRHIVHRTGAVRRNSVLRTISVPRTETICAVIINTVLDISIVPGVRSSALADISPTGISAISQRCRRTFTDICRRRRPATRWVILTVMSWSTIR
jgi:hypothetical protein